MNIISTISLVQLITYITLLSFSMTASSAESKKTLSEEELHQQQVAKVFSKAKYSKKGADSCLKCHDKGSKRDASEIFLGRHGVLSDPKSPMAKLQCETCHGPIGKHDKKPRKGKNRQPMITFGAKSLLSAEQKNSVCLACHDDHNRMGWTSSAHESEDVACTDCHTLHIEKDPVFIASKQNDLCTSCHTKQKIDIHKRSAHPVKNNRQQCSDCHNPHDSMNEASLLKDSVNDTCVGCHNEKRSPLFWEHDPVTEDCTACHDSHGSNNAMLLKRRLPQLCQDCHSSVGHSSAAYAEAKGNKVLGKSCLNCHSKIHGSNHPQGHLFQK